MLLRSSMYVTPLELPVWWIAFSLVVAPLERRFGWRRVLGGFVVGHVGATVAVARLQLWVGPDPSLPELAPTRIDVGASYGFFALAALATYGSEGRRRVLWIAAIFGWIAVSLALEVSWAPIGHTIAALLGFASFRLVSPAAAVRHEARVRARHLYEMQH